MKNLLLFITFQCTIALVASHAWLDCIKVVNPLEAISLANMQCAGYPANNVPRTVNPDANMHKVEGVSFEAWKTSPCCNSPDRGYTAEFPRTKVYAGDYITIGYTPNGHTSWMKPNPPPHGSRDFYIKWVPYMAGGTPMKTMSDVVNATTLYQVLFDKPCHDRNTGAELDPSSGLCTADIRIPPETPQGVYMFVWYWPFRFQSDTIIEDYTSCFDVEVIPPPPSTISTTRSVFPDVSTTGSITGGGTSGGLTTGRLISTTGSSSGHFSSGSTVYASLFTICMLVFATLLFN